MSNLEVIMPIVIAPTDIELTIVKILADEKTKRHLESLGVVTNGKITVISSNGGNTICVVKGIRLAFNRETASKILVA